MNSMSSRLAAGFVLSVLVTGVAATRVADGVVPVRSPTAVAFAVVGGVAGGAVLAAVAKRRARGSDVVSTDPSEPTVAGRAPVEPATVGPKDSTDWAFRDDADETADGADAPVVEVVDADATSDDGVTPDETPNVAANDVERTGTVDEGGADAFGASVETDWQFDYDLETK